MAANFTVIIKFQGKKDLKIFRIFSQRIKGIEEEKITGRWGGGGGGRGANKATITFPSFRSSVT